MCTRFHGAAAFAIAATFATTACGHPSSTPRPPSGTAGREEGEPLRITETRPIDPGRTGRTPAGLVGRVRVVDLTHTVGPHIPVYPGHVRFSAETLRTVEDDGYFARRFSMAEHVGTHVDAPAHFVADAEPVDALAAETLVGEAAVVDVSAEVARDPDYTVTVGDLRAWEGRHGALGPRHIVLVHTGWDERWPDEERFRGADPTGEMHFPGVSLEASTFLRGRQVRAIGIDTLSTDRGSSRTFAQHKDFLAGGGYQIENLRNLDQLPPTGALVFVGVLPLRDGSGAPARVLALVGTG